MMVKDIFTIDEVNEVDEETPSIILNGNNFIEGLECELTVNSVMTSTDAIYITSERVEC
jgi:hypothetical protein